MLFILISAGISSIIESNISKLTKTVQFFFFFFFTEEPLQFFIKNKLKLANKLAPGEVHPAARRTDGQTIAQKSSSWAKTVGLITYLQ